MVAWNYLSGADSQVVRTIDRQLQQRLPMTAEWLDESLGGRNADDYTQLAGLPNRRAFEVLFEKSYRAARASAEVMCVAFCDIDHFKRINDTHGHEAGDRVLKLVAGSLALISNDSCHVARHGDEES